MKASKALLISLFAISTLGVFAQEKTLFERLGGKPAIVAVVDEFTARCVSDARINKKFAKSDAPRLKAMLVDQICAASGGPCKYEGRDMKTAHKSMGVTDGEFGALVENLVAALDKFKVAQREKDDLLHLLSPMKPSIVEVNSKATG
ncbi:MAG: group 1 truncated hemoglobin, partial [Acidobacteriota bacterium]